MKIVLLPGLDGTGELFEPFIKSLSEELEPQVITDPSHQTLDYEQLVDFVMQKLLVENYIQKSIRKLASDIGAFS